jgi:transcription elongation factor GreA
MRPQPTHSIPPRPIPLTPAGYAEKQARLHYLLTERRPQVAEYLRASLDRGAQEDQTAIYEDARRERALLEAEIEALQQLLAQAVLLEPVALGPHGATQEVQLGSTVQVRTPRGERTLTIVSSAEAEAAQGKISDESPVGAALLGHRPGETVEVETLVGCVPYTILALS